MRKALLILALLLLPALAYAQFPTWPGQPGNPVGYAAAPGWPGSFTATACPSSPASGTSWANATIITNCTYSTTSHTTVSCSYCIFQYVDFKSTATADNNVLVSGSHILFIGCRFQSNYLQGANISAAGSYQYYFYDSIVPLTSFYTSPPGSTVWPGAGTDQNIDPISGMSSGVNSVAANEGYEHGIFINASKTNIYIDHCDIWGYGNSLTMGSSSSYLYLTSNYSHDTAYPNTQGYHSDGINYTNGAGGPSNVWIIGNATGMMGNTQALALQAATSGYASIIVNENYLSGDNVTEAFCSPGTTACTNSTFYGNQYSTAIENSGTNYASIGLGTGSVWACNRIHVTAATTWTDGSGWTPSSSEENYYWIYSSDTNPTSTTDVGSNTVCAITNPAAYSFGLQQQGTTSTTETVTLSNTNTATLSISSIAMQTGTQFSVQSTTCGAALASGANCSIVVKFSPTGLGPVQDFLQITDNTPGVTSPQLVPLIGVGCSSGDAGCQGASLPLTAPPTSPWFGWMPHESVDALLSGVRLPPEVISYLAR